MLRMLIFLGFLSSSRQTSNDIQPEDCTKIAQLDEIKMCYAKLANLHYNPKEIYSGIGNHKQLICTLRQNASAPRPEDEFVWLKDGESLQKSGSCFTASSKKWPAKTECKSYNFHTSDGIYFCINKMSRAVVSEYVTNLSSTVRQPWLDNRLGENYHNCKSKYELNVLNVSEKMTTISCGMVYSTMTNGNQLVTWWSTPNGTAQEKRTSSRGGINATLRINISAALTSNGNNHIFGEYQLFAANTHPNQTIIEIIQLHRETLLLNITVTSSENPRDSDSKTSLFFVILLFSYMAVMIVLALFCISRKIRSRAQTKKMKHDLRLETSTAHSQKFPVSFEMNTVSTYASGTFLAAASSSTAILTTNYDEYQLGFGSHMGLSIEDKSLQVKKIYSNPVLRNYLLSESCFSWKDALSLGSGHFATVYRLKKDTSPEDQVRKNSQQNLPTYVAMKQLRNPKNASDLEKFHQEILIMAAISETPHANLMKLLGVCVRQNGDIVAITEFCEYGSLRDYLRGKRNSKQKDRTGQRLKYNWKLMPKLLNRILKFAEEIASGMEHLEKHKFVHRDLALRNVFLAKDKNCTSKCGGRIVKIGDYGLTRDVFESEGQYSKMSEGDMPIKWMAPESLNAISTRRRPVSADTYKLCGIFTSKSDVWSYGIVLWELITLGGTPYPNLHYSEVVNRVIEGYRMDRPRMCPKLVYDIMQQCWQHEPADRPHFENILLLLKGERSSLNFDATSKSPKL